MSNTPRLQSQQTRSPEFPCGRQPHGLSGDQRVSTNDLGGESAPTDISGYYRFDRSKGIVFVPYSVRMRISRQG